MIALLADEDFNGRIIRGLFRIVPQLDLVRVNQVGLQGKADATILAWAASNRRVVLTHDLNTFLDVALQRARNGETMPGVVAVPQQMGIGGAISDLALIVACAEPSDFAGQIWYLPF